MQEISPPQSRDALEAGLNQFVVLHYVPWPFLCILHDRLKSCTLQFSFHTLEH